MPDAIASYPLSWPTGWPRTKDYARKSANFKTSSRGASARLTIADGVTRVLAELGRMSVRDQDIIVSTNIQPRIDGFPRSGQPEPTDGGVAVYWIDHKKVRRVMAIDRYNRVADNLAAIAATLDAMRAIERHGGAMILERAFTGFTALPAPSARREWWEVLGVMPDASKYEVRAAYRKLAAQHHPDRGGSQSAMAEINVAYQEGLEAVT